MSDLPGERPTIELVLDELQALREIQQGSRDAAREMATSAADLKAIAHKVFEALHEFRSELGGRVTQLERDRTKMQGEIVDLQDRVGAVERRLHLDPNRPEAT